MNQQNHISPAWLSSVTEALKLFRAVGVPALTSLAWMCLLMCAPAFLPSGILSFFGLAALASTYRAEISLVLGLAISFLLLQVGQKALIERRKTNLLKIQVRELQSLPQEEAKLLRDCLERKQPVVILPGFSIIAISLKQKGLLECATQMGFVYRYPHAIPEAVWNYMKEHPEAIPEVVSEPAGYKPKVRRGMTVRSG